MRSEVKWLDYVIRLTALTKERDPLYLGRTQNGRKNGK